MADRERHRHGSIPDRLDQNRRQADCVRLDGGRELTFIATGRHVVTATFDTVLLPPKLTIGVGVHHRNGMTADFDQRALDFTILRVAENGEDHYRWPRTRGLA
jgi:hypothetical protein